jgi:hypothetical protein
VIVDASSHVCPERLDAVSQEIARCRAVPLTETSGPLPGQPSAFSRMFLTGPMVNGSAAAMRSGANLHRTMRL